MFHLSSAAPLNLGQSHNGVLLNGLKQVVVAFPFGTQDYGNSTMNGTPVSR